VIDIEKSIAIEKNPVDVWNILTDFSGYRSWNPAVNHAALYGPVEPGSEIKALSGKWDFKFIIKNVKIAKEFEIQGRSIGLSLNLRFRITGGENISEVLMSAQAGGWLSGLFKRKVAGGIEDTMEIFLNSLKRRVLSGGSYEIEREDSRNTKPDSDRISMPTPFNLIYKTRSKKFRRGGLRLK
jgi:hypothetical protein